jgi:hypothetical protein
MRLIVKNLARFVLVALILLAEASVAAFSAFVVITPENQGRYPFLVQVRTVAQHASRSRIKIIGPVDGRQQAWVIVCKEYVDAGGQNRRKLVWYGEGGTDVESLIRLRPGRTALPGFGDRPYGYVEVELSHEQMRRAYIYIDYPFEVRDGGYYYSIDLAYYLEGGLGRKSTIQWETR